MVSTVSSPVLRVFPDGDACARAAAQTFLELTKAAAEANRVFRVALSGGSTPKKLYAILAEEPFRSQVAWSLIHFFVSDERNVPPDHEDSNYGAARRGLFSKVEVPSANIHRVLTEQSPAQEAAARYQSGIAASFGWKGSKGDEPPRFDLIFLGMGADGHTASLFPGTAAVQETAHWVVANHVPALNTDRITFTYPLLNRAARVLLLVTGADKAERLASIFGPGASPDAFPVQRVRPTDGTLEWYLDEAAATQIPTELLRREAAAAQA